MAGSFGRDVVEVGPDGTRALSCPTSKGWLPRQGKTLTTAEHPGTAVEWEGSIFEVLESSPLPDGGMRYRLAPWDDRHAIRVIEPYDALSEDARSRVQANRLASVQKRRLSILFSPLLGHLPGHVQEWMEYEFGAPAVAMTMASALPVLVLGVVGYLFQMAASFGGGLSPAGASGEVARHSLPWTPPLPISLYLLLESGIRMGAAVLQSRPIGSLVGVLAYEVWRSIRGVPSPALRSPRAAPPSAERAAQDRFRMLEPLLAFLPPREQEILERRFGLDVLRWGRITAMVLLVVSISNIAVSVAAFLGGRSAFGDILWFLAGAYFLLEQLRRRRELKAGRPAGSVLGVFVRPLAKSLLAGG